MLRRVVGDETFFAGLREYRKRHERGNATRAELRAVFEELSGQDLKQFFDQWVETPYRPVLRASWKNLPDGRVEVTVRQSQAHAVVHPQTAPATWRSTASRSSSASSPPPPSRRRRSST